MQLHRRGTHEQREHCAAPYPPPTPTSSQTSCPSPQRNTRAHTSTLKKEAPSVSRSHVGGPPPNTPTRTYLRRWAKIPAACLQLTRAKTHSSGPSSAVRTEWTHVADEHTAVCVPVAVSDGSRGGAGSGGCWDRRDPLHPDGATTTALAKRPRPATTSSRPPAPTFTGISALDIRTIPARPAPLPARGHCRALRHQSPSSRLRKA